MKSRTTDLPGDPFTRGYRTGHRAAVRRFRIRNAFENVALAACFFAMGATVELQHPFVTRVLGFVYTVVGD